MIPRGHAQKILDDFIDLYWPLAESPDDPERPHTLPYTPSQLYRFASWHLRANGHPDPVYQVLHGWSEIPYNEPLKTYAVSPHLTNKLAHDKKITTGDPIQDIMNFSQWCKDQGITGWSNIRYTKDKYVPVQETIDEIIERGATA